MFIRVNEEVKKALSENRPVVALESTIISHGMPYPKNVETALNVYVEGTAKEPFKTAKLCKRFGLMEP